jgi:hypothetical protein
MQKPNFMQWYQQSKQQTIEKLDVLFKQAQEDFNTCDFIAWWYAG